MFSSLSWTAFLLWVAGFAGPAGKSLDDLEAAPWRDDPELFGGMNHGTEFRSLGADEVEFGIGWTGD